MTPNSFDIDTCKEVSGDSRTRSIEAKARSDADSGLCDPPKLVAGGSYWTQVTADMERIVYVVAHKNRLERLERMQKRIL